MPIECKFYDLEHYKRLEADRLAYNYSHPDAKKYHAEWFGVGAMWLCPWFHDPTVPDDMENVPQLLAEAVAAGPANPNYHGFSQHYWKDWAHKRPPIEVICPGGQFWCPDMTSTNGTGWVVTGEPPRITCTPSILVRLYHGYLRNGVFTDDLG
jgi:hypothetical protein